MLWEKYLWVFNIDEFTWSSGKLKIKMNVNTLSHRILPIISRFICWYYCLMCPKIIVLILQTITQSKVKKKNRVKKNRESKPHSNSHKNPKWNGNRKNHEQRKMCVRIKYAQYVTKKWDEIHLKMKCQLTSFTTKRANNKSKVNWITKT